MVVKTRNRARQDVVGFADIPTSWLFQLYQQHLDSHDCRSLSQVSKFWFQLMLRFSEKPIGVHLSLTRTKLAAGRRKLSTALQHAEQVELSAEAGTKLANPVASLSTLLSSKELEALKPGDRLHRITLKGMNLHQLCPSLLHQACPALQVLELNKCVLKEVAGGSPRAARGPVANLTHLILNDVTGVQLQHVKAQLKELPKLSKLSLRGRTPCESALSSFQPAGQQITSLAFETNELPKDALLRVQTLAGNSLKHLELCWLVVDDQDLDILLSLTSLDTLHVLSFRLQQSHATAACRWKEVVMTQLDMMGLAHMPLPPTLQLTLGSTPASSGTAFLQAHPGCTCQYCSTRYLSILPAAIERVQAAGGIRFSSKKLVVLANENRLLEPAVPVLRTFHHNLKIRGLQQALPEALFKKICSHLSPNLQQFTLSNFQFAGPMLPLLLPSLPPATSTVYLQGIPSLFPGGLEVCLKQVCAAAVRPVLLKVDVSCEPAGWQERVQAVMEAAGHQHVTVKTCDFEYEDSDGLDMDISYDDLDDDDEMWEAEEEMGMFWGWEGGVEDELEMY